ncbi:hypothetical protein ASC95_16450 [Pelomonas sp. Root1217]|uniref:hypothetical protein n=1 Tax=Pelomonas sp. Root1217 TaxID=1736430 RepID=UPI00070F9557|nr:hypothetical protein [Pelomonas sp. Root1217]KQV49217.1 hypothetical protein ASC95_16450 [Pelomonas sp. Root1217]
MKAWRAWTANARAPGDEFVAPSRAAPDRTVDFESAVLPPNEAVSDQFLDQGLKFDSAFANADMDPTFAHISGNRVGNFRSHVGYRADFAIHFVNPVSATAFAMVTANGGVSTFDAYLHGGLIESATAASSTAFAASSLTN